MKRHPMLAQGLTIAGLVIGAAIVAVALLYYTGMDFRG